MSNGVSVSGVGNSATPLASSGVRSLWAQPYPSPQAQWERARAGDADGGFAEPEALSALLQVAVAPQCVQEPEGGMDAVAYTFAYVPAPTIAGGSVGNGSEARHSRLVVAFRGAASLEDALCGHGASSAPLVPLRSPLAPRPAAAQLRDVAVHAAFLSQMQALEPLLESRVGAHLASSPRARVMVTGHSLGGGVACVGALLWALRFPGQVGPATRCLSLRCASAQVAASLDRWSASLSAAQNLATQLSPRPLPPPSPWDGA